MFFLLFIGLNLSAQTRYYYVAASVDTVLQDSVDVSVASDLIDSIYARHNDLYVTIMISDTLFDDFQTLVLNNHRANWTYTSGQDCDYYVFDKFAETVYQELKTAESSDELTFDKAIDEAATNYPDWTQIYLKLPR